jgi:hypothetical protein
MNPEPHASDTVERLMDFGQALLLLAVPALGTWGIRLRSKRLRRQAADAELAAASAEAIRVALDADRAVLDRLSSDPADFVQAPEDWLRRCAVLRQRVDDSRNRLWVALGYPDPRTVRITAEEREVLAEMSRTLRLRTREMSPEDRSAYLEEQRRQMRRAAGLPEDEGPLFADQRDEQ